MGKAKILNASAGSGKTYQLAYKYVRDVVERPWFYRHILAVTFTNKATAEMKGRILQQIDRLATGAETGYLVSLCDELGLDAAQVRARALEARTRILHDYSRFTVLTIDRFFQRILRAFVREVGIDVNYNVEIETETVLESSADALIDAVAHDAELRSWLLGFVRERLDDAARWDVREGILSLGREIFSESAPEHLAGARSKKELGATVARSLARAAEAENRMKRTATRALDKMEEAGVLPSDFKGASRSFAHYFVKIAAGEFVEPSATVRLACEELQAWCSGSSPRGAELMAAAGALQHELREMVQCWDENCKLRNAAQLLRENYRSFALLGDLYDKVQERCAAEGTLLLSQTKRILSELIASNDAPFIYEKAGNRYEHFMIDEFQDTSRGEWANFLPLLRNALSQSDGTPVLLVGDVKQSIYRWRGGDWRILGRRAAQELGVQNILSRTLDENYRSLPRVVAFNNEAIAGCVHSDNANLNAMLAQAVQQQALSAGEAAELHDLLREAYRGHTQTPRAAMQGGYVHITVYDSDAERAEATPPPVVERICRLMDQGYRPGEIMVLVRGNEQGRRVAAELLAFKGRNADPRYRFEVMTQEALALAGAPIVHFLIANLRLAIDPTDAIPRAVYNSRFEGRTPDAPLDPADEAFFRMLASCDPEEAFERIVMRHSLQTDAAEIAYIQALHERVLSFCSGRVADIPLFLRWWDERGSRASLDAGGDGQAIEISTIHKAKGLEKRAVVIPYCNWQLDPKASTGRSGVNIVWADSAGTPFEALGRVPVRFKSQMARSLFSADYYRETVWAHIDNINLLYVALTRARESLHIMIPSRCTAPSTVGGLLRSQLRIEGEEVCLGSLTGTFSRSEGAEEYAFGELTTPAPQRDRSDEGVRRIALRSYPTSPVGAKVRLRLPSQRYFEQEAFSPRNYGVLMHRAFENAATWEEIDRAVDAMRAQGDLSACDARALRHTIDRARSHPVVKEWFGGQWDAVRNENDIIVPGSASPRRPDRVMIRGERAVVVDYKFGLREEPRHARQISEYTALLRRMGYRRTEGWIWYVGLDKVERVE